MTRRNPPQLLVVTGLANPPTALLERWKRFHQRDEFDADVVRIQDVRGVPRRVFKLGDCTGLVLAGDDDATYEIETGETDTCLSHPWLVAGARGHRLYLVSAVAMDLSALDGQRIAALLYDPVAATGKEHATYRHHFKRPLPRLRALGASHRARGARFEGGRYRIEDWLYD